MSNLEENLNEQDSINDQAPEVSASNPEPEAVEPPAPLSKEERIAKMVEEDIAKMKENESQEGYAPTFDDEILHVRAVRNQKLKDSDWTQVPDVPTEIQEAWKAYRQELRDIPAGFTKLEDLSWPEEPSNSK